MISVGSILHDTYRIDAELGRGGMGCVYAATHMRLPRRVAVKVLMQTTDGQSLKRFRREAEICSQIGHRNIVEVFDFNEVDGQPYIVMELLTGESLRQRLDREPVLARPTLIQLVREVGKALAAAHAAEVVHRDLKPANLFISKEEGEERFKVLDFGISKIVGMRSLQTRDDLLLGTPGYMSPEQARGDVQSVNAKADQFSLATIVYEALSGKAAFVAEGDTPYTVLYKIVHKDPPPLTDQQPEVRDVLTRALAKEPADRYPDVAEMAEALVAALARVPDTRPYAPLRVGRSRRWPLVVAAVGAAAALGAGAIAWQRAHAKRAPHADARMKPSSLPQTPSVPKSSTSPSKVETSDTKAAPVAPKPLTDGAAKTHVPTTTPATTSTPAMTKDHARSTTKTPKQKKAKTDDEELSNPYEDKP
ncbi:MAG TPA: serine/threonine-protein kinase [Polyangia bacterium]|nr:serine/threonine-protein kinase [Polyangia bacterium]